MKATFKTVLSVVLSYLMVISILPLSVLSTSAADINLQGEGTQESPYRIYSADEFVYAMGEFGPQEDIYLSLESNIDVSEQYQSIVSFKAHINGQNHTITANDRFAGTNNGTVCGLVYKNRKEYITSSTGCAGGFVLTNAGILSGVFVHADLKGSKCAIISYENRGNILSCAAFGSVNAYDYDGSDAAGISIINSGTISNCYVAAGISASGDSRYGVSHSHPISLGTYENSFFDSTICPLDYSGGYSSEFMRSSDFIDLLNTDVKATDSLWTTDSANINNGYPVLAPAYNARIRCSKTNTLIQGTETIELLVDDDAEIRFTTDGSEPNSSSAVYTAPIEISDTVTIRAIGYKNGLTGNSVRFDFAKIAGEGTEDEPYLIDCEAAFLAIPELSLTACYEVTNDFELTKQFRTLGDFYGTINGNDHTIGSVWSSTYQYGLFKKNYGSIQNLHLVNSNQNFKTKGALVYQNYGIISNCSFSGRVTGNIPNGSSSENASYRCKNGTDLYGLGGFVSFNYGTINNSTFVGSLDVIEGNTIGGFVGVNDSDIINCCFEGNIDVDDLHFFGSSVYSNKIGGFVGFNTNNGNIDHSTANTDLISVRTFSYAGGAAYTFGYSEGAQTECSCTNNRISFYANYLEWGGRETYTQTFDGEGYREGAHKHNYHMTTILPTCTEDGTAAYTCSDCGDSIEAKAIPKLGHDFVATIIPPTYEEQGYTEHVCSRCGESYRDEYVEEYKTISGSCGENCSYSMDTGVGTMIISGSGSMADYAKTSNYSTDANTPWYAYRNCIKRIVISDGVTSIGDYAFYNCENIESIDFGNVVRIGKSSFVRNTYNSDAPLTEINLPISLKTIDSGAFYYCYSLKKLNYQGTINDWAEISFVNENSNPVKYTHNLYINGEAVTNVNITASVTEIKPYAFYGFSEMKRLTLPDTVSSIGKGAFYQCRGLESITMPCSAIIESGESNSENFDLCDKISKVTLTKGNGIMVFNSQSPWHDGKSALTEVVLSDGIESICDNAFKDCINLEFVTFPNNPYTLGGGALSNTLWMKNHVVNGLYIVGNSLIDGSLATGEVVIPGNVTEIKKMAFANNGSITSLTIPESVVNVEEQAFYNCYHLKELTVPCSADIYKDGVFSNTKYLEKLTMTKGTGTTLAFATDSRYLYTPWYLSASTLTTVVLEEGITNIGTSAFRDLTKLKNLSLPGSLKSIGNSAFNGDSSLSVLELPDGFETIGTAAFYNCTGLKEITMPCSTDVGTYLSNFGNCTNIEKITMTKGTGVMGSFNGKYNCTPWYISRAKLKEFILEDGITNIGSYMFYGNTSFTGFEIPDSVQSIGVNAFYNCTNLKDMALPDGLENIYGYAFYKCTGLTNLSLPPSLKKISDYAYSNCSNISSISFNNGLTEIQAYAFQGCTAIDKVTMPESIEKMGNGVFSGCNNLSKAYILSRTCSIAKTTFPTTTTIFGYAGSSAQTYAQNNSRTFVEIIKLCPDCGSPITNSVTVDPTCTEKGHTTLTCDSCGHTETTEISEKGHTLVTDDGKPATCTDTGLTEGLHCSVCGEVFTAQEIIPSNGHTPVIDAAKAPTCTETGLTEGSHCSICGEVIKVQEVVPAAGHTPVIDAAKAPICKETGLTEGSHCSVCGEVIKAQEIIPATGHTEVIDEAKAPTCTETGLTEGSHCSVCGEVIKAQEIIPATGHTPVIDKGTAPACTETGLTDGSHCSVCGEIIKAQDIIPAKGHTPVTDKGYPATLRSTGLTDGSHCSVCGKVLEQQKEIPVLEYVMVVVGSTSEIFGTKWDYFNYDNIMTENSDGSYTMEYNVNKAYKEVQIMVAKSSNNDIIRYGDENGNIVSFSLTGTGTFTVTATPSANGYIVSVAGGNVKIITDLEYSAVYAVGNGEGAWLNGVTWNPCDKNNSMTEISDDVWEIEYKNVSAGSHQLKFAIDGDWMHNFGGVFNNSSVVTDAVYNGDNILFETKGLCTVKVQLDLRNFNFRTKQGAKFTITIICYHDSIKTEKGYSADCTHDGLTDSEICEICGTVLVEHKVIPAKGHTEVIDKGKAPTCTETGLTDGSHCSVCGEIIKAQEVIPATGHTKVIDKGKAPTCTETGLTDGSHCSVCGEIIKAQEVIPATGHTWDNGTVTKAADCHHEGEMTYRCSECHEKRTEVIPMLEHQWDDGTITKEPTYTEPGEVKYTCSLCGDTRTEPVPCKEKKGKLTISNETVRAGDEVTVKLYLDENPGITALSINVNFPNRFILKDVQYMGLFPNQPSSSPMNYNPFTISWASPTSTDIDNTGLFAVLTFDVGIDVPLADYPITVTYNAENVFDSAFVNVPLDIENSTVSVLKPTPGDVNRDGNINMKDLVLIQQLINRWDVQIVESAADVTDDGEINMKDLVLLQRYINGWEVVLK